MHKRNLVLAIAALSLSGGIANTSAKVTQASLTQYTDADAERWMPTFLALLERDPPQPPTPHDPRGVDVSQRQAERLRTKRYSHLLVELNETKTGATAHTVASRGTQLPAIEGNTATVLSCAQDTGNGRDSRLEVTYTYEHKRWVATRKQFAIVKDCNAPEVMQVTPRAA